jgi:hypothetical protein
VVERGEPVPAFGAGSGVGRQRVSTSRTVHGADSVGSYEFGLGPRGLLASESKGSKSRPARANTMVTRWQVRKVPIPPPGRLGRRAGRSLGPRLPKIPSGSDLPQTALEQSETPVRPIS